MTRKLCDSRKYFSLHSSDRVPEFYFFIFNILDKIEDEIELTEEELDKALGHYLFLIDTGQASDTDCVYSILKEFFVE